MPRRNDSGSNRGKINRESDNPSKISLSKGGGGRKTFKIFLSKFWVPIEKLALYVYLITKIVLKAFQKNEFHYEFNSDKANLP